MDLLIALFAILNAVIVVLYISESRKNKRAASLLPLVASLIVSLLAVTLLNEILNETSVYFILNFAVLFSVLPFYYLKNTKRLLFYLLLLIIEFFYVTYVYGSLLYPFLQTFAIGTLFGVTYRNGFKILEHQHERASKDVETKRDIVHIILGAIILALFLYLKFYYAVYAVTTLLLIGYIYNSRLGKKKSSIFYSLLASLERPTALYGLGALYLAIGMALLLGFIHNLHFVIIGIAALLFADPIATIFGINFDGPKLFYNKKKSVIGTLAFVLAVTIIGYPFISYYALLFGAALAFVESLRSPVDDNIVIPVVMIFLYIAFLASLNQLPSSCFVQAQACNLPI